MAEKKDVVLTMYGKDEEVESVSVNFFDASSGYYSYETEKTARLYCRNINELELTDNRWVYAQVVTPSQKVALRKPLQFDVILRMDDRDVQLVLRELQAVVILHILKGADEEVREKIFGNMSKNAAADTKENLEAAHGIGEAEINMAKSKLIEVVQKMSANGNIGTAWGKK
jgi:hypothetical protein